MKRKNLNSIIYAGWIIAFQLIFVSGFAQQKYQQWIDLLKKELEMSSAYDELKWKAIIVFRSSAKQDSTVSEFSQNSKMFGLYESFHFDSAHAYANRLSELAAVMMDSAKINQITVLQGAVLVSAGLFKEAFDSLASVGIEWLNRSDKIKYYAIYARAYTDLVAYNQDEYFNQTYEKRATAYIDSCLSLADKASFEGKYFLALKKLRSDDFQSAADIFKELIHSDSLDLRQQAVVYSTFSDIYIRKEQFDSAIVLLCKAAIADIQSSTKETTAVLHLASLLFKQGDVPFASYLIQRAATDARFFGARQRLVQLSASLSKIEAQRVVLAEMQKLNLGRYATIVTLVIVLVVILGFIIFQQLQRLKIQQTEIRLQNSNLLHLVEEKEWLLKEIHHRVKNNLQTITSLLESQSAYLRDDALQAVRNSQHRVNAMALIHQKLYHPETNSTGINMVEYIYELVGYLRESLITNQRIKFSMDFKPVLLDISLAVPIGLILNEAISNSIKYAFPNNREGNIRIGMEEFQHKCYVFVVADDGIGLPPLFDSAQLQSLGLKLMKGLCDDIGADFLVINESVGTRITFNLCLQ